MLVDINSCALWKDEYYSVETVIGVIGGHALLLCEWDYMASLYGYFLLALQLTKDMIEEDNLLPNIKKR